MNELIINGIDHSKFDLEWAKRGGVVLKVGIHSAFFNYLKTECVIDNYHCHYFAHLNSNLGYGDTYTTNTFCDLRMATPAECAKAGIDYIEPPMMWRDIESAPMDVLVLVKTDKSKVGCAIFESKTECDYFGLNSKYAIISFSIS